MSDVHGSSLELTLQVLDPVSKAPLGAAWTVSDVPILADGSFTREFRHQADPGGGLSAPQ